MDTKDLSKLSEAELLAELKKREAKKENDRDTYKQMVEEQVGVSIKRLQKLSDYLSSEKFAIFTELRGLLELKRSVFSVKETQQTHTFTDKRGNSIVYGFRTLDTWDDTVNAGIEKVKEFLGGLAKDDNSAKLILMINGLLKKDAKGNLKASRVLELIKMSDKFDSELFRDGVEIIRKAHKPVRSAYFIEASCLDAQGVKKNIPLSISSCNFPEGTDVDGLFYVDDIYLTD